MCRTEPDYPQWLRKEPGKAKLSFNVFLMEDGSVGQVTLNRGVFEWQVICARGWLLPRRFPEQPGCYQPQRDEEPRRTSSWPRCARSR